MVVVEKVFGEAYVLRNDVRTDCRGSMTKVISADSNDETGNFGIKETRVYSMPYKGTFFGIHYRDRQNPMSKLVTVIQGRGMDYLVDLRTESPTYLQWRKFELSAENGLAVLNPAGIGHAFLSLEDNTIQLYSVDKCGEEAYSEKLNYQEKRIGLELEIPIIHIAEYDENAPYLQNPADEQEEISKNETPEDSTEELISLNENYLAEIVGVYKRAYAKDPRQDDWEDTKQLEEYIKNVLVSQEQLNFGLLSDGNLIAVSLGNLRHWYGGSNYNIEEFCVDPKFQRQGIGSRFLQIIEAEIEKRGIAGIYLQAERDKPAYDFLKKNTFNDVENQVGLYKAL